MTESNASGVSHKMQIRIYYEDTDAGGVVYYANYLRFAERGRMEFLRAQGYDHRAVCQDQNVELVARHVEVDYRAPARLDDFLDIETRVLECKNSSVTMGQTVSREGVVLNEIKVTLVAVNLSSMRAVRIPQQLRDIFLRAL
jgi:acyl-CoA thioester hydrolase